MSLVSRLVPTPTREDRARALRAAVAEAQRYGVTSVQVAGGTVEDLELYDEAARARELGCPPLRCPLDRRRTATRPFSSELEPIRQKYADGALFKAGALKIGLDGVIESHTAAMLEPYANRAEAPAFPTSRPDDLNKFVRLADARGWQVMTHAIGDRAIREALDAYAHAARSNAMPPRGRRHRIEHIETMRSTDIARFGALGVIASMQPFHGNPEPLADRAVERGTSARSARRAGGPTAASPPARGRLAFGSDWPVVSLNPMLGLHTAVNRTSPDGEPEGGWYPSQKLSLKAAVNAYTAGSAWASFDEQRKGTLSAGMLADIVILSRDIFSAKARPADLASTGPSSPSSTERLFIAAIAPGRTEQRSTPTSWLARYASVHDVRLSKATVGSLSLVLLCFLQANSRWALMVSLPDHGLYQNFPARLPVSVTATARVVPRRSASAAWPAIRADRRACPSRMGPPRAVRPSCPFASIVVCAPDVRRSPRSSIVIARCNSRRPLISRTRRLATMPSRR